jgi:hypothetical protein
MLTNRSSTSSGLPIYNPSTFVQGTSLSHLNDACLTPSISGDYFVMDRSRSTNDLTRYYQTEELEILCGISLKFNNTYGSASAGNFNTYSGINCDDPIVAGVNDGLNSAGIFTIVATGGTATFTGLDLLGNDYSNTSGSLTFSCLEVIDGPALLNTTEGDISTNLSVTFAGGDFGVHLLRYIPVLDGVKGNLTYVYISYPGNTINGPLWSIEGCNVSSCNLINNGDFESETLNCSRPLASLPCWKRSAIMNRGHQPAIFTRTTVYNENNCGYYELFKTICSDGTTIPGIHANTFTIPATNTYDGGESNEEGNFINNAIIYIGGMHNGVRIGESNASGRRIDYLSTELNAPLVLNEEYKLSFWVKGANLHEPIDDQAPCLLSTQPLGNNNRPTPIGLLFSTIHPPTDWNETPNNNLAVSSSFVNSIEVPDAPLPMQTEDGWVYREVIFTADELLAGKNVLTIYYDMFQQNFGANEIFYGGMFLDEISLVQSTLDMSNFPLEVCTEGILDLNAYITGVTEDFVISCIELPENIVVDLEGIYSLLPTGMIPGNLYTLSITYITPSNCVLKDYSQFVYSGEPCCNIQPVVQTLVQPNCTLPTGSITVEFENHQSNVSEDFTFIWDGLDEGISVENSLSSSFIEFLPIH